MKIEIQPEQKVEEITYPCLMIAVDKEIVLMTELGIGTVIYAANNYIGYYSQDWHMNIFKPFKGKITLENS